MEIRSEGRNPAFMSKIRNHSKELQNQVFGRFRNSTIFAQGTGLGLNLKAITEAAGGEIGLRRTGCRIVVLGTYLVK